MASPEPWRANPDVVKQFEKDRPGVNFDESKVPAYTLPPVLEEGVTRETWPRRREALVDLLAANAFGRGPGKPDRVTFASLERKPDALDGQATLKRIGITSSRGSREHTFELILFVPNHAPRPAGVFLMINNRGPSRTDPTRKEKFEFWPAEAVVARGYAIAAFQNSDLAPDDAATWRTGVARLFEDDPSSPRAADAFGALAAWAWGASRCADYFAQDPDIDPKRIAVLGHSRGGKTALWAGATDERFSVVISNDSGCGGAAIARRGVGETPAIMNRMFPHWMNERYKNHARDVSKMPFDQHQLLAAIAPRAVYVASGADDLWADPKGEFQALAHAGPAFELFGDERMDPDHMPGVDAPLVVGRRGYHVRTGGHGVKQYDWDRFIDFADRVWSRHPDAQTQSPK